MYKFRKMRITDVKVVTEVEKKLFSDPWPEQSFANHLGGNDKSFAFVAEKNQIIAGYIVGWYYAGEIHIGNVAVKNEFQNQRLGTFLVSNLFNTFSDYEVAYLEVRRSNLIAKNLYNKFGFKQIYIRKSYYNDGEDAVVMTKSAKN